LQGIYVAGASHDDGGVTLCIAGGISEYSRRIILHIPLPKAGAYTATIRSGDGARGCEFVDPRCQRLALAEAQVEVRSRCVITVTP